MVLGGIGGCFRRVTDGLSSGETRLESLNALSEDTVYESVASRTENAYFSRVNHNTIVVDTQSHSNKLEARPFTCPVMGGAPAPYPLTSEKPVGSNSYSYVDILCLDPAACAPEF
jgi:hypothetical protein